MLSAAGGLPRCEVTPASEAGVVYGSLNNFAKITADVIACWAEIVRATPAARLHLLSTGGARSDQRIAELFAAAGLCPDRIRLLPRRGRTDYFSLYDDIDVALDPFPYTGCNTTCDALWMGAPVITLAGWNCMGRQSLGVLSHLGLPELIASSVPDYVRRAVQLAGDLPRLGRFRASARARMEQSTLVDAAHFTRQLEEAYRWMWTTTAARKGPN